MLAQCMSNLFRSRSSSMKTRFHHWRMKFCQSILNRKHPFKCFITFCHKCKTHSKSFARGKICLHTSRNFSSSSVKTTLGALPLTSSIQLCSIHVKLSVLSTDSSADPKTLVRPSPSTVINRTSFIPKTLVPWVASKNNTSGKDCCS